MRGESERGTWAINIHGMKLGSGASILEFVPVSDQGTHNGTKK